MMQPPKIPRDTKKKMSPKSLANLKLGQQKAGEPSHSPGRKGWDGNGGHSLKTSFKTYLKNCPPGAVDEVWRGLINQAQSGNTNAIKMLVELSGEQVNDKVMEIAANIPALTITVVDPTNTMVDHNINTNAHPNTHSDDHQNGNQ